MVPKRLQDATIHRNRRAEAVLTFKVNMDAPQGPDVTILNQGGGDAGREEEHSQDIFGTNEEDTEAFYNRLMQ